MAKINTLKPRVETLKTSVLASVAVERIRGWKLTKIRNRILLRDNYTCRKCGRVTPARKTPEDFPGAVA